MKRMTKWCAVALSPLTLILAAQAEPISDQGLVRSFVERVAFPGKASNGDWMLPVGMRQALSVANLFTDRDIYGDGSAAYGCRAVGHPDLPVITAQHLTSTSD